VLQQGVDGGQEALAVMAAGVKLLRRLIGGGDQHHALVEQRAEQPTQ